MMGDEMLKKRLLLIPIALFLFCLFLMFFSFIDTDWAKIQAGEDIYEIGLFSCSNCQNQYKSWDWKCFSDFACISPQNLRNCLDFTAATKASRVYICLEFFALISGLLLIDKLVIAYYNKHHVSISVYLLSSLMSISHLISYLSWLYLINQEVISSRSVVTESGPRVYSKEGSSKSMLACVLSFIAIIILHLVMKSYEGKDLIIFDDTISLDTLIKRFTMRRWMFRCGLLFTSAFSLISFILYNGRWVLRFTRNSYWQGGLLACQDCNEDIKNLHWNCLQSLNCASDFTKGSCELYSDLALASKGFIIFEAIAFIFFIFFLQAYIKILAGKHYGFPIMNYLYAIGVSFFNFLATIAWFYLSRASLTLDCQREPLENERPPACSTVGPFGLMFSNVFLIPMSFMFCYAYYHREIRIDLIAHQNKDLDSEQSEVSFDQSNLEN
ncbi:unnamed protein product [Blepharisma stoltei]|uniref:Uncharacterized protein n=1 Tax=Blepharisma stoltei TaxID=1481888 RepID=A0AAU9KEJ3_9CILI|nr:unnamed protein product [Blepharisma stoltei]